MIGHAWEVLAQLACRGLDLASTSCSGSLPNAKSSIMTPQLDHTWELLAQLACRASKRASTSCSKPCQQWHRPARKDCRALQHWGVAAAHSGLDTILSSCTDPAVTTAGLGAVLMLGSRGSGSGGVWREDWRSSMQQLADNHMAACLPLWPACLRFHRWDAGDKIYRQLTVACSCCCEFSCCGACFLAGRGTNV